MYPNFKITAQVLPPPEGELCPVVKRAEKIGENKEMRGVFSDF